MVVNDRMHRILFIASTTDGYLVSFPCGALVISTAVAFFPHVFYVNIFSKITFHPGITGVFTLLFRICAGRKSAGTMEITQRHLENKLVSSLPGASLC